MRLTTGEEQPGGGSSGEARAEVLRGVRHLGVPRSSLRVALSLGAVGPSVAVLTLVALRGGPLLWWAELLVALAAATGAGVAAAWWTLGAARSAAARDVRTLTRRLERLSDPDQRAHFDALLAVDEGHPLRPLATAAHGALASAHRDRLEARRLKRELDARVAQSTRKQTARLTKLSVTDELTGLVNRRGFEAALGDLAKGAYASSGELSVLAFDLDRFKALNDAEGHAAGDEVLRVAAQVILAHCRETDIGARVGGDELFLLLPGVGAETAAQVAERIRLQFARHPASSGLGERWPGMSIGVASLVAGRAATARELVEQADAALYASKNGGRGRVTVWTAALGRRPGGGAGPRTGAGRAA